MDVSPGGLLVERRDAEGAGKGLFATQSCPRSSTLFTIPAGAMINLRTLSPLYPAAGKLLLTANQMITLHLTLHMPREDGVSHDPGWGPYISTLPQDFESHPVTWAVRNHGGFASPTEEDLLSLLPPTILSALSGRVRLFMADWHAICQYTAAAPNIVSASSRTDLTSSDFRLENHNLLEDCLWAWLNVNTRCIYYQLDSATSAPENMTLCPILDFANHRPNNTHIVAVQPTSLFPPTPGSLGKGRHGLGGDYIFMSSSETPVHKDEELFLRYGSHSNRMLLVEYGFGNLWDEGECRDGKFGGEVDVQDMVEKLFAARGAVGRALKEVLETEGYWGDWTMHSQPVPAHPSYRLISALRLSQLAVDESEGEAFERALERWRAVLWGQEEQVSAENEQAWRDALLLMCERIAETATSGMAAVRERLPRERASGAGWTGWMLGNIERLWREEYEVAEAVASSVRGGVEF
ncbi:SET domain-containing protein [Phanerochaete sordida]|uniref:SET domain-containing protein n=1 Tax=Phanerochaete sordida TaxID=48140 RepID=A0A9P3LH33_9APHY|nr:SET domain-containing protein [Phanerochaete sordida]